MKNIITLNILFFCAIVFSFVSCSDDEGPAYNSIAEGSISMSHDGESWESTLVTGISVSGINNYNALKSTESQLSLTIENNSIGAYLLGEQSLSAMTFSINSTAETYGSFEEELASGTITVEEENVSLQTISGSFDAVLVDSDGNVKVISNGLFNKIRYN